MHRLDTDVDSIWKKVPFRVAITEEKRNRPVEKVSRPPFASHNQNKKNLIARKNNVKDQRSQNLKDSIKEKRRKMMKNVNFSGPSRYIYE